MVRLFFSFYLMLLAFLFVHQIIGELGSQLWVRDMIVQDKINDDVGVFHLLEQLQQNLDEDQFKQVIREYPSSANIPIKLFDSKAFDNVLPLFNQDNIYTVTPSSNIMLDVFRADPVVRNTVFYKFQHADLVVRIGPSETYQPLIMISEIYEQSIYFIVGLCVLLWMFNLQRKLNRLDLAAIRLGEGDFTVRVSEKGSHKVGNLNKSFNLMAQRIQSLIQGHKNLTNAVAHELRTPISRLRFQLDMMYEEIDETKRKEYIYGISDDVDELTDLVDELLSYARFEREVQAQNMQLHSLDESLKNVIRDRHFDSKLMLTYDNSWFEFDKEQQYLCFQPKNLERAIGNLLSNAIKYANNKIQITVERGDKNCIIYVDDDGPGIPEKERTDIFLPFKRLDNSRTRATGGYGLGLAIAKQIIQYHGGEISIVQAPIGGARFVICWPVE